MESIISTINLGLLTFFIPWAFFLLDDIKELTPLDKNILFDKVVCLKKFIIYTFLIFIPLFPIHFFQREISLNNSLIYFDILYSIGLILWTVSLVFFTKMLFRSYSWVRGDRYEFRFLYINELKNESDIKDSWNSVWSEHIDERNLRNEEEFVSIFLEKINALKDQENISLANELLKSFEIFFDKRSIILFLIRNPDFFKQILDLYFWSFENKNFHINSTSDSDENPYKWFEYQEMFRLTNSIFKKLTFMSLNEKQSYSYFKIFEKYIDDMLSDEKNDYIMIVIQSFFSALLNSLESTDNRYDFWDYFPEKWKINNKSINNFIPQLLYNSYINFIVKKLESYEESRDSYFIIDNLTLNILPELDPKILSWIITLILQPNIADLVKNGKKFGLIGKPFVSEGLFSQEKFETNQKVLEDNTIRFVMHIYKSDLTKEKIDSLLKEVNAQITSTHDRAYYNKEKLKNILEGLRSYLNISE